MINRAIVFGLVVAVMACKTNSMLHAHGSEQWIANKALRDPVTNAFCCGVADCRILDDDEVTEEKGGFYVRMHYSKEYGTYAGNDILEAHIPYARALPVSPDGKFHACISIVNPNYSYGTEVRDSIRCFIVPPGES